MDSTFDSTKIRATPYSTRFKLRAVARKYGSSGSTYYNWKAKFGGMTLAQAERLKELEQENNKLTRLLAESMLDNAALWDLLARK
ncbi:MAG TPA: transposase [Paraburkholderia sp.]